MAITLDQAKAAGPLAQQIADRQDKIALINAAIADGNWQIATMGANNRETGAGLNLIVAPLDPTTTLQCLSFALQVYQAQIDALNAQLAAL